MTLDTSWEDGEGQEEISVKLKKWQLKHLRDAVEIVAESLQKFDAATDEVVRESLHIQASAQAFFLVGLVAGSMAESFEGLPKDNFFAKHNVT